MGKIIRILKTYGDGPKTKRGYAFVSPDIEFFNELIRKSEDEGLEFIGQWHRHPGTLSTPTQGDISTIKQIMDYNNLREYVAMIVTGVRESAEINTYIFKNIFTYDKVKWEVERPDVTLKLLSEAVKMAKVESEHKPWEWLREAFSWLFGQKQHSLVWYESIEGKRRLLLEKRLMNYQFPRFNLFRKGNDLFWASLYKNHIIILMYPENYPAQPIRIKIKPELNALPDERDCFYATIAAQIAYLRIENAITSQSSDRV